MLPLPFTAPSFFVVAIAFVSLIYAFKARLARRLSLAALLLVGSAGYLAVTLPEHMLRIGLFLAIQYGVLVWFHRTPQKKRNRFVFASLMVLPMILAKLNLTTGIFWFFGFSYMTFRAIQLLYEEKLPSIDRFALFLTFTPSLLAGPIDRYSRFNGDLAGGYARLSRDSYVDGLRALALGVFQKFVVAECINRFGLEAIAKTPWHGWRFILDAYLYFFFFYFDFAGYSHMAIGLARMLGVDLPRNFNHPYLARNPKDFWARFHISLGNWLKDYLFVPAYRWFTRFDFFKKRKLLAQNIALFLTFQSIALWNGFTASYFTMGALFGLYSVAHNSFVNLRKAKPAAAPSVLSQKLVTALSIFAMFNAACLAFTFFSGRAPFTRQLDRAVGDIVTAPFLHVAGFEARGAYLEVKAAPIGGDSIETPSDVKLNGDPMLSLLYRSEPGGRWKTTDKNRLALSPDKPVEVTVRRGTSIYAPTHFDKDSRLFRDAGGGLFRLETPPQPPDVDAAFEGDRLVLRINDVGVQHLTVQMRDGNAGPWKTVALGPHTAEVTRGVLHLLPSDFGLDGWQDDPVQIRVVATRERAAAMRSNILGDAWAMTLTVPTR